MLSAFVSAWQLLVLVAIGNFEICSASASSFTIAFPKHTEQPREAVQKEIEFFNRPTDDVRSQPPAEHKLPARIYTPAAAEFTLPAHLQSNRRRSQQQVAQQQSARSGVIPGSNHAVLDGTDDFLAQEEAILRESRASLNLKELNSEERAQLEQRKRVLMLLLQQQQAALARSADRISGREGKRAKHMPETPCPTTLPKRARRLSAEVCDDFLAREEAILRESRASFNLKDVSKEERRELEQRRQLWMLRQQEQQQQQQQDALARRAGRIPGHGGQINRRHMLPTTPCPEFDDDTLAQSPGRAGQIRTKIPGPFTRQLLGQNTDTLARQRRIGLAARHTDGSGHMSSQAMRTYNLNLHSPGLVTGVVTPRPRPPSVGVTAGPKRTTPFSDIRAPSSSPIRKDVPVDASGLDTSDLLPPAQPPMTLQDPHPMFKFLKKS